MTDEEEYTEEILEVMVNAEGETPYGPIVNYNGQPINKNSAHNICRFCYRSSWTDNTKEKCCFHRKGNKKCDIVKLQ